MNKWMLRAAPRKNSLLGLFEAASRRRSTIIPVAVKFEWLRFHSPKFQVYRRNLFFLILSLAIALHFDVSSVESEELKKISTLLGTQSALSVVDLKSGKLVHTVNADKPLVPASTLKILTSVVALEDLGSTYTFKTKVFSFAQGAAIGIKGGGDPELTSEQVYLLARQIRLSGAKNVQKLVLDSSALKDKSLTKGPRAYQAGSEALSFNFNSAGFQICPGLGGVKSKAVVQPLIWEDALEVQNEVVTSRGNTAELSLSWANNLRLRVSGNIGESSECATRYLSNPNPLKSLGNYLRQLFDGMGMGSDVEVVIGQIPPSAKELLVFESKPLASLLIGLNHFSTNVSAEHLLAAIGLKEGELSRARGLHRLSQFVTDLGYSGSVIEDGSGLSHANRLSAQMLTALLKFVWENPRLRPTFEASLPILGETGTLKRRGAMGSEYQVFAKSGTLDGVSSLAGYLHLKNGSSFAFALLQNEVKDLGEAHKIEERILKGLAHMLLAP